MKITVALTLAFGLYIAAPAARAETVYDNRISLLAGYAAQSLAKYRALSAVCGSRLAEIDMQMFVDKLVSSGRFGWQTLENHIKVLSDSARMTTSDVCDRDYVSLTARAFDRERKEFYQMLD